MGTYIPHFVGHHVEGEYVNLKDPTHTHRGDTLSAPKMIPHSTYLLLHCMTTNGTWIGLQVSQGPNNKVNDNQT